MVQAETLDPIIVICGPTAVGKTAAGIRLAQKIGAEIVSADSGQIYRGMDIGTAKPTAEEQKQIPFHLIDVRDPSQTFSAANFREEALKVIEDIQGRGKRVVVVGGTGLYLKVLEKGIFEGPSSDPGLRQKLTERLEREGQDVLHRELASVDPIAARGIPAQNRQRLLRALEVFYLTGRPISSFWKDHEFQTPGFQFLKYGLSLPQEDLHRRIHDRVDNMLKEGLVEEVEKLIKRWGKEAPALHIIGYKEVVSCLSGSIALEEMIDQIRCHTRQYAKRQMTWFRKDPEILWNSKGLHF